MAAPRAERENEASFKRSARERIKKELIGENG